jgi:hypothetical protein
MGGIGVRQNITPAMNKMMLTARDFYAIDLLHPLISEAFKGRYPSLYDSSLFPVNIIGGYMFGANTFASIMTGSYSPQQIIKPGKDTVDLQADIWWLGPEALEASSEYSIGWAVQMSVEHANVTAHRQILYATALSIMVAASGSAPTSNQMWNPRVASVDSDGHIDWRYTFPYIHDGLGTNGNVDIDIEYPAHQWAVGYGKMKAYGGLPGLPGKGGRRPALPFCFYKTPIRLVIKKGDVLTTDPTYTFRNFRSETDDDPLGVSFQVFRLNPATCDGVFQDGVFGNDTSPYTLVDAVDAIMGDPRKLAPIFVGMEMKIL